MYTMDARKYNVEIAKGCFRKVYPAVAKNIHARTGVGVGFCVDLGGGPGLLGISYARITNARVTVYDPLEDCVAVARENIAEAGLQERVEARLGRAEAMDFPDDSVDLVMSRGSIYFWDDQKQGLAEVHRVLKPGGWAYIGGGFGSAKILAEVVADRAKDPTWAENRRKRMERNPPERFQALLSELGLPGRMESSDEGSWIVFQKQRKA